MRVEETLASAALNQSGDPTRRGVSLNLDLGVREEVVRIERFQRVASLSRVVAPRDCSPLPTEVRVIDLYTLGEKILETPPSPLDRRSSRSD